MHRVEDGSTVLVVEVADLAVALPVEVVREVLRMPALTPLPGAPAPVAGIVDLRGSLVAVVDLRRRLELPERDPAVDQQLVVVDLATGTLLLWVDGVRGLRTLAPGAGQPFLGQLGMTPYLAGVARADDGLLFVHDVDAFLDPTESAALELAMAAQARD